MKKGDVTPGKMRVAQLAGRVQKRQEAIVAKCHPAVFEIARLWKDSLMALNSLGPNPPSELAKEIEGRFNRQLDETQKKYSGDASPAPNTFAAQVIFSDAALQSKSDDLGVAEWIHFERHKTSLKVDAKRRSSKDYDASRRILRTIGDLEELRCNRKIHAFKGELEHRNMFETLWGLGVERFTPEELVIFFDEYCPCGKVHDPDALKKLRNRFLRLLKRAI